MILKFLRSDGVPCSEGEEPAAHGIAAPALPAVAVLPPELYARLQLSLLPQPFSLLRRLRQRAHFIRDIEIENFIV